MAVTTPSAPGNVLYITVDQWRGDCLAATGHPALKTSNLDRHAARGVRRMVWSYDVIRCGSRSPLRLVTHPPAPTSGSAQAGPEGPATKPIHRRSV